jgi:hypothetical protein
MAHEIAQDSFWPIVIIPGDVELLVDHEPSSPLLAPLPHDPCLPVVDVEPFLHSDRCNVYGKAPNGTRESFASREKQIVGVARKLGPGRLCQAGQAGIETVGGQVGQGRRCRRALGQVRLPVTHPRPPDLR